MDLSYDVNKIKTLTGDNGENLLGQNGELCKKVEDELQRLKNHSHDALGRMQNHINRLEIRLDSEKNGCFQVCSGLQDDIRQLREDVRGCTSQCKNGLNTPTG